MIQDYLLDDRFEELGANQLNPEKGFDAQKPRKPEFKMLLGEAKDTEKVRDKWINAVERILELESFEKGEMHLKRKFDTVQKDGDYGRKIPKWMIFETG